MEDFLMEHDNRHQRMHSLLFKPLKCWCCGELNEYDLPEGIKGLILLDAVNLSEEQEDLILGTTGTGEAAPEYPELSAKLRRMFGKESRARRRTAHAKATGDGGDDGDDGDDEDVGGGATG